MKRKIFAMILCLIVCLSTVAGCSLITRNDEKYYEASVCTISYADGTQEDISKRELLIAYNSYGSNYVQNYGMEPQQAVETTLNTIVNQHLTIKSVKKYYADNNEGLFNDNETTYLWDQTYDAVFENLKDYYYEVASITDKTGTEDNSSDDTRIYKDYDGGYKLERVDGQLVLKNSTIATTTRATYPVRKVDDKVLDFEKDYSKEYMYNSIAALFEGNTKQSKNWRSAFNKYISQIEDNYTYKAFENNKECFMFEMNRIYEIVRDNYIVQKYSEIYNRNIQQGADQMNIAVDDILKSYSSKVRTDYETYKNNRTSFDSQILTDTANMDYIYDGAGKSNFFNIAYIKINFTTEQQELYNEASGITGVLGNRNESEIDNAYNSMYVTMKDEDENTKKVDLETFRKMIEDDIQGIEYLTPTTEEDLAVFDETKYGMTKTEYVEYYNTEVLPRLNGDVEIKRAELFRDKYFNPYNDDTTYINAERCAVAGVNNTGEAIVSSTFSDNDDVKQAIVDLYNNGNAKIGDLSQLVRATDGMYLFFYAGELTNPFAVLDNFDISKNPENIKVLEKTRLSIFSNKTYLDKLVEELRTDNFSTFQNMNIANLRKTLLIDDEKAINFHEDNLKDLYN